MKKLISIILSTIMVMTTAVSVSVSANTGEFDYIIIDGKTESTEDYTVNDTSEVKDVMTSTAANTYNVTKARYTGVTDEGTVGLEYNAAIKWGRGSLWSFTPNKTTNYNIFMKVYLPGTDNTKPKGLTAGLMTATELKDNWNQGKNAGTIEYKKITATTGNKYIYVAKSAAETKDFTWVKMLISPNNIQSGNNTNGIDTVSLTKGTKYYLGVAIANSSDLELCGAYIDKILIVESGNETAGKALADETIYTSATDNGLTLKASEDATSFPDTYLSAGVATDNPFAGKFTNAITGRDDEKVSLSIDSITDKNVKVIVAGYDSTDTLVGCHVVDYSLHLGNNEINYDNTKLDGATKYKTFLWKNTDDCTPIAVSYDK